MSRVKKGVHALKRRRKILKLAKGFRFGRSRKERDAKTAILHAGKYAFAHRRKKKREMRKLFQIKIGASAKTAGISYSKLMGSLGKKKIAVDRKILAILAERYPETFARIVEIAKK